MKNLLTISIAILFLAPLPISSVNKQVEYQQNEVLSRESLEGMVWDIGIEKGLSGGKIRQIIGVINCESSWDVNAIGDDGTSFGLVQIHLPAHPSITAEQANNPVFAIDFITSEFKKGNEHMWTCWNNMYRVE